MAKRIKVAFYVHEWTLAGTARSHLRILEALDRDRFEPYAMVWDGGAHDLLPHLTRSLGDHVISFKRSQEKTGPEGAYMPLSSNLGTVMASLHPDIFHHARGGYREWPLSTHRYAPLQVETNIFGDLDTSPTLDRSIAICNYIAGHRGKTDAVIYNPIPPAVMEGPNLRARLYIPEDAIVCGRIGRPANFDPIALEAFIRVQKDRPNLFYIVVAPCESFNAMAFQMKAKNVICFAPTTDDTWIESFYRTLDIFLHYRSDGEVMSTAIAQAMMYGIPVISHTSPVFNGQADTLATDYFIAKNVSQYEDLIEELATQPEHCKDWGRIHKETAEARYLQSIVVRQIESKYKEWIK